jgi:hypothetical protein
LLQVHHGPPGANGAPSHYQLQKIRQGVSRTPGDPLRYREKALLKIAI